MTVSADLDLIQARLHDDGTVWTRSELLRLYQDAYRQFLAQSGAVRRWRPTDLPGRHTYGITQEWEDAYTAGGTVRKPTRAMLAGAFQGMSLWEVEAIEGITPTESLDGHTQEWERAYRSGDSDLHYRFSFPRNHERVVRLEWQHRKLHPVAVRELDDSDTRWFAQIGEPRWWTTGAGRVRSVELYEIATAYYQAYALPTTAEGIARQFSGERTWAVDVPIPHPNAYAYTASADVPTLLSGLGSRLTQALVLPLAYSEAVLADAPLAYYKMDETSGTSAADSSGNGNTGTYSGPTLGATLTDDDVAASFDGSDDLVTVPSAAMDRLRGTIELVIRPGFASADGTDWTMIGRDQVLAGGSVFWLVKASDAVTKASFYNGSGFDLAESAEAVWTPGEVVHLAVTYDLTAGTAALYVNGRLLDTVSTTAAEFEANGAIVIGRRPTQLGGSQFYRGLIGHVAFYEGVLPASRIRAHAAAIWGHSTEGWYATQTWETEWLGGEEDDDELTEGALVPAYTWEHQHGAEALTLAVGQPRSVSSPDRQYLAITSDATLGALLGRIVDWRSSEDAVFALEVVVPDADLAEDDTTTLLPAQLTKYLRYYVLSRAFGRPGEGRQPIMADFYARRFQRGVDLFRAFGDVARYDRTYQREDVVPAVRRPPYVRLPSTFPSVWR